MECCRLAGTNEGRFPVLSDLEMMNGKVPSMYYRCQVSGVERVARVLLVNRKSCAAVPHF